MDPFTIVAIGGALTKAFSGLGASSQARTARIQAQQTRRQLDYLERTRQQIINPYENIKDLSSMVTNPFANLQVATKASEIQGQEADISLASTLDTLRATGGAGSATALAQAALRSKQGISATIAQQEAQNAQLRAQGEQRMQQIQLQEAARVQGLEAAGKQFVFSAKEQREMQKLDRTASLLDNYMQQQQQAKQSQYAAFGSLGSDLIGLYGTKLGATTGVDNGMNPLTADAFDQVGKFVNQ